MVQKFLFYAKIFMELCDCNETALLFCIQEKI